MFREYDKDKNGLVKEDLKKLLRRLCNDECIIGKIPKVSDDEVSFLRIKSFYILNFLG
jgi:hypothetical protein